MKRGILPLFACIAFFLLLTGFGMGGDKGTSENSSVSTPTTIKKDSTKNKGKVKNLLTRLGHCFKIVKLLKGGDCCEENRFAVFGVCGFAFPPHWLRSRGR